MYDDSGAPSGMRAAVDYATELFDAATVRDLADRLVMLLGAVAADPGRPLRSYDVLTAAERTRLAGWGPGLSTACRWRRSPRSSSSGSGAPGCPGGPRRHHHPHLR
ncbi:hypothetical protein NKH18_05335 [Streptomyces sp. M10(2022)]